MQQALDLLATLDPDWAGVEVGQHGTLACLSGVERRGVTGVASLGVRPTVKQGARPLLETFVFDFDEAIYGRRIAIEFLHKLRDEERYDDLDALTRQIRVDVEHARDYFATVK